MKVLPKKPEKRRLPRIFVEVERGQAIVILALAMVGLIGFTAVAIDGGNAYFIRRNMQNAADGSLVSGIQQHLDDTLNGTPSTVSLLAAIHESAEVNSVEDTNGTAADCINDNVWVWYIDIDGYVVEANGTVHSGVYPDKTTGLYRITDSDANCATTDTPPVEMEGIEVVTYREFGTFLAGVIGQDQLAAEGRAAAVIDFDQNGCSGEFAAFGMDNNVPAGTVSFSGTGDLVVLGDMYTTDSYNVNSKKIAIDGVWYYADPAAHNPPKFNSTDVWIGPLDEVLVTVDPPSAVPSNAGNCTNASNGGTDWTYYDMAAFNAAFGLGFQGNGTWCIYTGYSEPQPVAPLSQPFTFDLADFQPGGYWADHAAGCDDSADCSASGGSNVTIAGDDFIQRGNYFIYNDSSVNWTPPSNPTALTSGLYYFPPGGANVKINNTILVDNSNGLSIAHADGDIDMAGGDVITSDGESWKPYGNYDGSGVLIGTWKQNTGSQCIHLSGSSSDSEGIIYAPGCNVKLSGTTSFSGAILGNQVDLAGAGGSVTFDIAYCPPPHPTIIFKR